MAVWLTGPGIANEKGWTWQGQCCYQEGSEDAGGSVVVR